MVSDGKTVVFRKGLIKKKEALRLLIYFYGVIQFNPGHDVFGTVESSVF